MRNLPALIPWLVLAGSGCVHWDAERNAPGHIVVAPPPTDIACEAQESPRDPGEHVIDVFPTAYLGGGAVGLGTGAAGPATALGAEISLLFGAISVSHREDDEMAVLLRDGLGFNLGVSSLSRERRLTSYGEVLLRRKLLNVSPGWAWDWRTARQGPQLTLSMLLVYLRATHLIGEATDISVGIYLGPVLAFIWSR